MMDPSYLYCHSPVLSSTRGKSALKMLKHSFSENQIPFEIRHTKERPVFIPIYNFQDADL